MDNEKKTEGAGPEPTPTPQPANNQSASATGTPADQSSANDASGGTNGGNDELTRLKAEAADLKDRLLRAHAEMDNLRKRHEREKADVTKFAITKFARDVVVIGDNVQRAIDAVPTQTAEQDPALKSFLEGVTMIEREFINVLERHGVKRIDPKGEQFNPHFHQAVMEMPVADVPSGTVTQVFQHGYTIEERVLRPAMVVVAKGGMKAEPSAAATDAADTRAAPDAARTEASPESGPGADGGSADSNSSGGTSA